MEGFSPWAARRYSGIYALTGLTFQPGRRDLDKPAPTISVADATGDCRRMTEQLQ
jgi:hypothetical protein